MGVISRLFNLGGFLAQGPTRHLSPAGSGGALSQTRRAVVSADGEAANGQLVGSDERGYCFGPA